MAISVNRFVPPRRRWGAVLALVVVTALPVPSWSRAEGDIDEELAAVARQLSAFLKRYEKTKVSVGQFTGPPQLNASAGPGIAKILADELADVGIDVKKLADLGVQGQYRLVLKNGTTSPEALIKGQIEDMTGKPLFSFTRHVRGEETLAYLFGLTVNLPASETAEDRSRRLVASVTAPETAVKPKTAVVSAGEGSPYGVEILVKSGNDYVPRTPATDDGLAFVDIKRGEQYAVTLVNDSDGDAAVTLQIDGINMFAFCDEAQYSYVIVPRRSKGMIPGWYVTAKRSDAFEVVEYARSEAAKVLPNPGATGTVTALFAAAWPKDAKPPADERKGQTVLRGRDATGRGPSVETEYRIVERVVGVLRASVSVRYNKTD